MPLTREEIKSAAMSLGPADREQLAEELLLSISESERQSIESAWLDEVRRRDSLYEVGKMTASSVDQVIERIQRGSRP